MDPGFASFGWVIYGANHQEVLSVGVIRTKKAPRKEKFSASQDNLYRATQIYRELRDVVADWQPEAFAAESMSFPRSSSVAQKMGISWGIIASLFTMGVETSGVLPFLQASPQHIKKSLCGSINASKEEVQAKLTAAHPPMRKWAAENGKGLHEHAFDALAAAVVLSREMTNERPADSLRQGRRRSVLRGAARIRWRRS
jgi:Holliday junction resolvasome RuvABC endonuclease subunit